MQRILFQDVTLTPPAVGFEPRLSLPNVTKQLTLFIFVGALRPSQQFSSHVIFKRHCLPLPVRATLFSSISEIRG